MVPNDGSNPIFEYARPMRKPGGALRVVLITLGGIFVAVPVLLNLMLPSIGRSRETANRVKSASNLRQIGQAISLYCNDHGGTLADSFATLLLNEDITSAVFVNPSANDLPADGPTTQAVVQQLATPGHVSYAYLGKGLTMKMVKPDTILAYESPLSSKDGMNVLFGDGHVDYVDLPTATKIMARTASGQFPMTMPSN